MSSRASHALRQAVEDAIERLVAVLDLLDGDADLEPSLAGWQGAGDDREDDPADGPEDCDWVPSIEARRA